ncbi:MAG: ATP-grasp domain-containing protein, partial [Candidatus Omnitrophica bacterium]|nr:ATP-grasp domain-containing protein [Candidatus Omnitrophota bacterium]
VVTSRDALIEAVENAWQFGEYALIEQYVSGREMTVGILAEEPLEVIEISTQRDFFDFTAKYQAGQTVYQIPAELPLEIKHELQETALKVHAVMGCRDLSRVDFRLNAELKPYVLEINTIPGFTELSLLPKAAAYGGIPFDKLCQTLLRLAYGKKKETKLITADH